MDCSPPSYSVHGISQARTLEWVAISFSRGSSQPRDQACTFCIGRWSLYHWAPRDAPSWLVRSGQPIPVALNGRTVPLFQKHQCMSLLELLWWSTENWAASQHVSVSQAGSDAKVKVWRGHAPSEGPGEGLLQASQLPAASGIAPASTWPPPCACVSTSHPPRTPVGWNRVPHLNLISK